MTSEKAAYYAGLFDGEGCVSIVLRNTAERVNPDCNLVVSIANQCSAPLQWLKEWYTEGSIRRQSPKDPRSVWVWACGNRLAQHFLEDIFPFTVVKKPQVELALEFRQRIQETNHKLPEGELEARLQMAQRMKELKREVG